MCDVKVSNSKLYHRAIEIVEVNVVTFYVYSEIQ